MATSSPEPLTNEDVPVPDDLADRAVELVAEWSVRAASIETNEDRQQSGALSKILSDPAAVSFTMGFVDRVARPDDSRIAASQLRSLVDSAPLPSFLSPLDRLLLRVGSRLAPILPALVMPLAQRRLRGLVGHLIVDSKPDNLVTHVERRRAEGKRLNVNLLGEAVLGHDESDRRLKETIDLVARDEIDYVSVKISSVAAQLHPWAFDENRDRIVDRLRPLFRVARDGDRTTFINLDMEEYSDLELTTATFMTLLDSDEFRSMSAGIVLQAYLPDSFGALKRLVEWATRRRVAGGGEIKIRLVKGANLAMEKVEAAMMGWEQAPYSTKADTDANYKRCLDWLLTGGHTQAVRVGVASHNLFDLAWTHLLSEARGVSDRVSFEMLQGMAPAQSRAISADKDEVVLYTPAVAAAHFDVAISYLIRRLEENATPENFMYSVFGLSPGSENFMREEERFRRSVARRWRVNEGPNRKQDRLAGLPSPGRAAGFQNEPDTDPSLSANRMWGTSLLEAKAGSPKTAMIESKEEIDLVVEEAEVAAKEWSGSSTERRRAVLDEAANELSRRRGDLVSAMVHEANKTIGEADPEVSEAIDFARYYAERVEELDDKEGARFAPFGTVVVAPPWNFPVAIPAGGVLASLAAGNSVILKPTLATPRCAEIVAECLWAAGVPENVLRLVRCRDNEIGEHLITHRRVGGVILTGSVETAELFRGWKPEINLLGETSGKNSLVITPNADVDLAVTDLVQSAFGHSGQKCSAASLAICVGSLYSSERFRRQLGDSVRSIRVGPATSIDTTMGPLIAPADGKLLRALTQLEPGEEWLVEPRMVDSEGMLWSPGVRVGVKPGSWFHQTECFGPVLGLMYASDLMEAVAIQNSTPFGLTGGIHSLEPQEIGLWLDKVEVGNAYVNRSITGAMVRRQPFGGWKRSAIGSGAKAGGPNYVMRLGHWTEFEVTSDSRWLAKAERSDEAWWGQEFSQERDESGLFCEANVFRYRALKRMVIRVAEDGLERDVTRSLRAAERCGVEVVLSRPGDESDSELASWLEGTDISRVRLVGTEIDLKPFHQAGVEVVTEPVVASGRIELPHYLREQAISRTRHRFGNVYEGLG